MKTDPQILEKRKYCIEIAKLIPLVLVNKTSVTDADRLRYNTDLPELIEVINRSPLWDGHLTMCKKFIDGAMLKATQIDNKPGVPRANAYYGREVAKMPRKILEAQPPQKTDKESERLPDGHRNKKCSHCHKFIYRFDVNKNRIRPDKETGDCPTCIKYRDMLQRERNIRQAKSDDKRAKRKAKEAKGKPDPKYVKAKDERHKKLREKERAEGAPSREERREKHGF